MTEHATQPPGLTDGRRKLFTVRVVGDNFKFMASEFNADQSRSKSDINASKAPLSLTRLIKMDRLYFSLAVNGSVLYESELLQLSSLVYPVDSNARLWNRQDFSSIPTITGLFCLNQALRSSVSVSMPRSRAIPRRGGWSGIRGKPSHSAPQQVAPIALVPPSSPLLDQERFIPNNSHQTSRFIFQSRLNRPVVTVNLIVFVSEEESTQLSSTPSASAHSQDDSILLGDMNGLVFHVDRMHVDAPVPEVPQQPEPTKEDDILCEPSQKATGCVHLVTDSDGAPTLDEDGFVTWVASPSQAKEDILATPSHAD